MRLCVGVIVLKHNKTARNARSIFVVIITGAVQEMMMMMMMMKKHIYIYIYHGDLRVPLLRDNGGQ